jgi:salicylate 5-hydroxylase small subunit
MLNLDALKMDRQHAAAVPATLPPADYISLLLFYQRYAEALDSKQIDDWPEFFTDVCLYQVQSRENFDAGLPLSTLCFESKGMLKDRVYAIRETLYYEPYLQRHVVGVPIVTTVHASPNGDLVHATASYAVFRTKPDHVTEVYNVGRYVDEILRTPQAPHGWLLRARRCVFDSDLILNSMIDPI